MKRGFTDTSSLINKIKAYVGTALPLMASAVDRRHHPCITKIMGARYIHSIPGSSAGKSRIRYIRIRKFKLIVSSAVRHQLYLLMTVWQRTQGLAQMSLKCRLQLQLSTSRVLKLGERRMKSHLPDPDRTSPPK